MSTSRNEQITTEDLKQLSILVAARNLSEIQRIINTFKDKNPHHECDDSIMHAVRDAFIAEEYEIAKFFIADAKVSANYRVVNDQGNYVHLIYFAVKTGKLPFVQLLVENGAEIKPKDRFDGDNTGIRTAIEECHHHIAEYLLFHGAECNGVLCGDTYIVSAAAKNDIATVDVLARHGATKNLESSFSLADEKYNETSSRYRKRLTYHYSDSARNNWASLDSMYVKKFDDEKSKLTKECEKLVQVYNRICRVLMDYAVGYDFSPKKSYAFSDKDGYGLTFLRNINVSDLNFVGVSVGGHPVTHDMLQQEGLVGWEHAIVTISDLENHPDLARKNKIKQHNSDQMEIKGLLIRNDVLNFVPIWRASEIGDVEVVKVRLASGGDPNEINEDGSAIVYATKNCHETIIDILSSHLKFDPKSLPDAILVAGKAGHEQLKLKLLDMQLVDQVDSDGNNLLHHAVNKGDVTEVSKLIARRANVNLKGKLGYPLHIAARKSYNTKWFRGPSQSHIQIIRILLANGADPNQLDGSYSPENALMKAARAGSAEAVGILLPVTEKKPITKNIRHSWCHKDEIIVPWFLDMMFESYESREWLDILKLLKAEGADINLSDGRDTLLQLVMSSFLSIEYVNSVMQGATRSLIQNNQRAYMEHLKLLDFLLENNVDVAITNKNGNNVLHEFVEKSNLNHIAGGYARIIDKFLRHEGFDINMKNSYGYTLLHIAADNGNLAAVKYLISRGADVDAKNKWGNTPLHLSVGRVGLIAHAYPLTTACLVKAGAKTEIRNHDGLIASERSLAVQNEFMQTERFNSWEREVKAKFEDEFQCARNYLTATFEGTNHKDFNGHIMQNFIKRSRETKINNYSIDNISNDDKLLVDMYRDDVTQQIMQVPVMLNERLYDLDTLIYLHNAGLPDPFTKKSFNLSRIEPAEKIADEIKLLIQYLQKQYPVNQNRTSGGVPVLGVSQVEADAKMEERSASRSNAGAHIGASISAPGVNGVFGQQHQHASSQITLQKSHVGCVPRGFCVLL